MDAISKPRTSESLSSSIMDPIKLLDDFPYGKGNDFKKRLISGEHSSMIELFVYGMKLLQDFPYATVQDVDYRFVVDCKCICWSMEPFINCASAERESEKLYGRDSICFKECKPDSDFIDARPLLHLHSLHVQPKDAIKDKPLSVYGTVRVKSENIWTGEPKQLDVYNRSAENADKISPNGGNLTLGLSGHYDFIDLWTALNRAIIIVDLHLIIGDESVPLAQDEILVGDTTEGDLEEVRSKEFNGTLCSATLIYIAMPFGVLCMVDIGLSSIDRGQVVNVAGKIAARYKRTYGNYDSQEFVIFEKLNDFQPVIVEKDTMICFTRMALPAYSTLELDLDLTDLNTSRKIIKKTVELFKSNVSLANDFAVAGDDFFVLVEAHLFKSPHNLMWSDSDEDLCESESSSSTSNNDNPWCPHHGPQRIPRPHVLAEFYSMFIGRKKMAALNIFGSVEFTSNNNTQYLFKRTINDVVEVEDSQKVLPLIDVHRRVVDYGIFELKVNLKDVGGKFQSKGFANVFREFPNHGVTLDSHTCSVFSGKDGFCALHYSIFTEAVEAKIEILFRIKSTQLGAGMIYGSAIAQYSNCDYSTEFKRDYFRSVLFKRTEKDPLQLENDGKVSLFRNTVVVPMYSSLIIDIDFCCMSLNDHLSCKEMFNIGRCCSKKEKNDLELVINCTWSDDGIRHQISS